MSLLFLPFLGIWGVVIAMFLLFCILAAFVENEKGFASFLVFAGMAALFLVGTEPNGITVVKNNLWLVGTFGAVYLVGALVYSIARWKVFAKLIARSYGAVRDTFIKKNNIRDGKMNDAQLLAFRQLCKQIRDKDYKVANYAEAIGRSKRYQDYLKFDDDGRYLDTSFTEHFRRIMLWGTYWPAAFLGNILYDFARHAVEEMVIKCRSIFESIAKREMAKFSDDLREVAPPPAPPAPPAAGGEGHDPNLDGDEAGGFSTRTVGSPSGPRIEPPRAPRSTRHGGFGDDNR